MEQYNTNEEKNTDYIEKVKFYKNSRIIISIITIILLLSLFPVRYLFVEYNAEPNIEILGEQVIYIESNEKYVDPGVKATLNSKDVSKKVKVSGKVDTSVVKNYIISYSITNNKGKKKKTVKRKVVILDKIKPVIKIKGKKTLKVSLNEKYVDPGYTASDNVDGDITSKVLVYDKVNTEVKGSYEILYEVKDSSKNIGYAKRRVVVADYTAPVITLLGSKKIKIKKDGKYEEPGYTATDNIDGDITDRVNVSGKVKTSVAAIYKLKYSVSDESDNYTYETRTVYVGTAKQRAANNSIKVSISSQYLTYIKNGRTFLSTSVVTGQRGKHDTPRGTYRILGKSRNVTLRGPGYASPVSYWMPINGSGVGLHDATWRSSFGGSIYKSNGSHGCINMPYKKAQTLFNNAPVGTIVYIY